MNDGPRKFIPENWSFSANDHDSIIGPECLENRKIISARELSCVNFPPLRWTVEGLFVEGLTMFAGKPKVGKSWFMLQHAIDVATHKGDVIYYTLEDSGRRLQYRTKKLIGNGSWPEQLDFQLRLPRLNMGGIDEYEQWLKEHPNRQMGIFDPYVAVKAPQPSKKSTYDHDYDALKPLHDLTMKYNVATVVVNHLRKQDSDDPLDVISGTLGGPGAVDSALILRRDRGGFVLDGVGRDRPHSAARHTLTTTRACGGSGATHKKRTDPSRDSTFSGCYSRPKNR